jgi:hypothetical protein
MASSEATIRVKLGQFEFEYQGDSAFLKEDLLDTVKELLKLQKAVPATATPARPRETKPEEGGSEGGDFSQSTDTIANIIGARKGPDLIVAAAAHLHFVKRKPTFTRQQLADEMRMAPGHYKQSYLGNLTTALNNLTKGDRLRIVSKNTYALSNKEKKLLESKLAED